ncbi:MAG: DUF4271 domain-containing protein [Paludibacter sp.]|nr:DUF4271 domain-containing protein [Paludibacter sp.]
MIQQDSIKLLTDSTKSLSNSLAKGDSLAAVDSLRHFDSLKAIVHVTIPRGFVGIPHPSLPQSESWIFIVLFILFFLFVFTVSRSSGLITETAKTFFQVKERSSIFSKATVNDFQIRFFLIVFSISVISLYIYLFLNKPSTPFTIVEYSYIIIITGLYFGVKALIFDMIGYIFLTPLNLKMAKESYFNIIIFLGICLFPLLILQVYAPNNFGNLIQLISLIISFSAGILVIIKLFQIFLHKLVASFYIFLYLCTLEILPLIVLYQVYKLIV